MRRFLGAAILLACLPPAYAQDKGKTDFTHNAEFRLRDTFEQNESGSKDIKPSHHNGVDQRFKLGLGFKANEKFSFNATLLQSAAWGQAATETVGDRGMTTGGGSKDERNFMSVNEAYASWMMAEDYGMKFGRMNFSFGDGSIMSANDWQAQPYAFDGVTAHYEVEFGRFQFLAFKYRDLTGALPLATTSDPQHDAYGVVFDLKTMPEWLKMVNVYVIQDVADGVGSSVGSNIQGLQNQNALRYGALAGFNFGMIDLKAQYNLVSGKNTDYTSGVSSGIDRSIAENMYQAEVGVNLPAFMGSRIYALYHRDSGTATADKASKDKTYDSYFYDKHYNSGLMEIVGWGNLTDISLGWTMKPGDMTDVGIAYHMFSKTESSDDIVRGVYGQNINLTCSGAGVLCTSSGIGSEVDLWAEHRYDGGLSMLARLGYFTPGGALKDNHLTEAIAQVMVQGKLTF